MLEMQGPDAVDGAKSRVETSTTWHAPPLSSRSARHDWLSRSAANARFLVSGHYHNDASSSLWPTIANHALSQEPRVANFDETKRCRHDWRGEDATLLEVSLLVAKATDAACEWREEVS